MMRGRRSTAGGVSEGNGRDGPSGASSRGFSLSAGVDDAARVSDGSGSGVDEDPELLSSSAPAGVASDGLGSGNCADLFADFGDTSSARTASGVKSGIDAERRAAIDNDCSSNVTGDVRVGLVDGDVVSRGYGVGDGDGASTDLANGGGGGWDCPIGDGCLGHDSDASSRFVGDVVGASCSDCNGCRGGVGSLTPAMTFCPSGARVGG